MKLFLSIFGLALGCAIVATAGERVIMDTHGTNGKIMKAQPVARLTRTRQPCAMKSHYMLETNALIPLLSCVHYWVTTEV